jgi:hypothetical protein
MSSGFTAEEDPVIFKLSESDRSKLGNQAIVMLPAFSFFEK